jgi:hypothetical protein
MSALSNTYVSQDSLYNNFLESFLKQGTRYILLRDFALGKGWDREEINQLYLYLSLLSNFSCDIESYFNLKLKEVLSVEEESEFQAYSKSISNADYDLNVTADGMSERVEFILKQFSIINTPVIQDNISRTIYVSDDNIAPYEGTLEEKIILYIESLGYVKEDIASEIWVEYTGILWG